MLNHYNPYPPFFQPLWTSDFTTAKRRTFLTYQGLIWKMSGLNLHDWSARSERSQIFMNATACGWPQNTFAWRHAWQKGVSSKVLSRPKLSKKGSHQDLARPAGLNTTAQRDAESSLDTPQPARSPRQEETRQSPWKDQEYTCIVFQSSPVEGLVYSSTLCLDCPQRKSDPQNTPIVTYHQPQSSPHS